MGYRAEYDIDALMDIDEQGSDLFLHQSVIDHLRSGNEQLFSEPYMGYLLFLVSKNDEEAMSWLMNHIADLDSLTGREIAFFIVTSRLPVKVNIRPKRDCRTISRVHYKRRGPLECVNQEQLVKIERLISGGRLNIDKTIEQQVAITYAVDAISKELNVLHHLPCVVVFDASLSQQIGILRLDRESLPEMIPLLRDMIGRVRQHSCVHETYTAHLKKRRRISEVKSNLAHIGRKDAYWKRRIAEAEEKIDRLSQRLAEKLALTDYTKINGCMDADWHWFLQRYREVAETFYEQDRKKVFRPYVDFLERYPEQQMFLPEPGAVASSYEELTRISRAIRKLQRLLDANNWYADWSLQKRFEYAYPKFIEPVTNREPQQPVTADYIEQLIIECIAMRESCLESLDLDAIQLRHYSEQIPTGPVSELQEVLCTLKRDVSDYRKSAPDQERQAPLLRAELASLLQDAVVPSEPIVSCIDLVGQYCMQNRSLAAKYCVQELNDKNSFYGDNWRYSPSEDIVRFSLAVPQSVGTSDLFFVSVYAHTEKEKYEVVKQSRDRLANPEVLVIEGQPMPNEVRQQFRVHLNFDDAVFPDRALDLYWTGSVSSVHFPVRVPDTGLGTQSGRATVYLMGSDVCQIRFVIDIGAQKVSLQDANERRYTRAFVSYASGDRERVLACIQGMKAVSPDLELSMDIWSIRPGEVWRSKLKELIRKADIFYLFWSTRAGSSDYVKKEIACALQCSKTKGESFICPVILEPPEGQAIPPELSHLHFNDTILPFILSSKSTDTTEISPIRSVLRRLFG